MADTNLPQQGGPESIDEGRRLFTLGGAALVVSATVAGVSGIARELIGVTPANAQEVQVASLDPKYIDLIEDKGNNKQLIRESVEKFRNNPKRMDVFAETVKVVAASQADQKSKSRAIMRVANFLASEEPSIDTLQKAVEYVPELKQAFLEVNARNNPFYVAGVDKRYSPEYVFITFINGLPA